MFLLRENFSNMADILKNDPDLNYDGISINGVNCQKGNYEVWHPAGNLVIHIVQKKDNGTVDAASLSFGFENDRSGCGTVSMYGLSNYSKKEWVIEFSKKLISCFAKAYFIGGVGTIFTKLGQSYQNALLTHCGFEPLLTYKNYRHGSRYDQTLYVRKITEQEIIESIEYCINNTCTGSLFYSLPEILVQHPFLKCLKEKYPDSFKTKTYNYFGDDDDDDYEYNEDDDVDF